MIFTIACVMQSSSLITVYFVRYAARDAWLIAIITSILAAGLFAIFAKLIALYPDKNLIEMCSEIFGNVVGKFFGLIFLIFMLTLAALNMHDLQSFVTEYLMPQTPKMLIYVTFSLVCAAAVRAGISTLTRYAFLTSVMSLGTVILTTLLLLNQADISNFLPIFFKNPLEYVRAGHILLTIPIGEVFLLLMISPHVEGKKTFKKIYKSFIIGLCLGAFSIMIVAAQSTAVLGENMKYVNLPTYEVLQLINLPNGGVSRIEVFFGVTLIIMLFFKVTLIYNCIVEGFKSLFKIKDKKRLVFVIGAVFSTFAAITYKCSGGNVAFASNAAPIIWSFVEYVIPAAMLIFALIKKRATAKKGQETKTNFDASGKKRGVSACS